MPTSRPSCSSRPEPRSITLRTSIRRSACRAGPRQPAGRSNTRWYRAHRREIGSATDAAIPASADDDPAPTNRPVTNRSQRSRLRGHPMILATTKIEDVDRFLDVFGTKGAEKRALHGSKGSTVFRDPTEENRVWALFDWDQAGWTSFVSDPDVPPILKEAGHVGKPEAALFLGTYGA